MSNFILPPGFIHITLQLKQGSTARAALVTMACSHVAAPWGQTETDNLFSAITTSMTPRFDSTVSWQQLVVLVGADGEAGRFVSVGSTTGAHAAQNLLPPNVAVLIDKQSGVSGRRNRGRMYIPFIDEGTVGASGVLTGAEQTLFQSMANSLFTNLNSSVTLKTSGAVILHSQTPTTPTPCTKFAVESIVATQRRRLLRLA